MSQAKKAAKSSKNKAKTTSKWRVFAMAVAALTLVGLVTVFLLYRHYVVNEPGPHLERAYILNRIARESPVYYRDSSRKMGVFFGEEHRQYVTFEELPKDYVNAIIAAEDKRYWSHPGFDIIGFTRAMLGNLKARRLVAGGSTITSQTAKNLYDRDGRKLGPKLKEVLNAFRLEAHYSKEEILEFYVNQFHVYGNGRGLGIAATYFFDKDVSELNTLECAFLAGVVKGPYQYNPFVGSTPEKREKARLWAERRVDYVLKRLADEGYLDPAEAERLMKEDIPFKQGKFRFEHNVILDAVNARLQDPPFDRIFEEAGIEDPSRAGLQIVTTIDADYQRAAEYGLAHHLTDLSVKLEGLKASDFFGPERASPRPLVPGSVVKMGFFNGRITEIVKTGKNAPHLKVDIGEYEGIVDKKALMRVAGLLKIAEKKDRWARASKKDLTALVDGIAVGQGVRVSVRDLPKEGPAQLDLEAKGKLQGAVIALDEGEIRAMVGGSDNRNYNRAITAKRQFGSTYKSLIYAAAMTLGWSPLAPLDNRIQGFPFQNQPFYWPRPDHDPPAPFMSLAWSGATSENLAAISLLYHLTDPLTEGQRMDLAKRVGMAQGPDESQKDYKNRIRDVWGVLPTETSLREGLFEVAKAGIGPDLAFDGLLVGDGLALEKLPYGRGFPEERARLSRNKNISKKGRAARKAYLQRNFLDMEAEAVRAKAHLEAVLSGQKGLSNLYQMEVDSKIWPIYSELPPEENWEPIRDLPALKAILKTFVPPELPPEMTKEDEDSAYSSPFQGGQGSASRGGGLFRRLFGQREEPEPTPAPIKVVIEVKPAEVEPDYLAVLPQSLLIEGITPPEVLERLRESLENSYEEMKDLPRYDMRRLVRDRDFCLLLSLNYVIHLAQETGTQSEMKPVLSLPLGANDTTLLETAMLYQSFLEGKVYDFGEGQGATTLLQEVRDADGQVLWKAESGFRQVMEPWVANSMGRLLRGVVERGTGRQAEGKALIQAQDEKRQKEIEAFGAAVPLFGKTGTTNAYVNAAFAGFVPKSPEVEGPGGADLSYGPALTVASYVGYDNNTPMKRGNLRLAGSSGALPVWLYTAKGIVEVGAYAQAVDLVNLAFEGEKVVPVAWPAEMRTVIVDKVTGLPVEGALAPDEGQAQYHIYFGEDATEPMRRYEPFHSTRRR